MCFVLEIVPMSNRLDKLLQYVEACVVHSTCCVNHDHNQLGIKREKNDDEEQDKLVSVVCGGGKKP